MKTLARVQRGLESLYRVTTGVDVHEYVVGADVRDELVTARRPREQLLVCEDDGDMSVALFIDPSVLANLAANDPSRRLGDHNLGDFLLAVEGVSHFIYTICCARAERPVSQLELELQAEVDKYVTCLLTTAPETDVSSALRQRLFADAEYEPDLDHEERARYRAANDNAQRYAAWLEETFVTRRRIPEMLGELRRFYRMGLAAKLSTIARAA
ncbi:MAG: hypothetical protein H0T89_17455 [Deltaproteobacteria bacterium]|nr:hypothetical protein [Deltaproteobacteria bacterium]MDQ3297878.1 hypothetical protein [Myxococcota bacterium]